MPFWCEEVDNASRDNDSNRQDYVSNDVDVRCLDVYVVLEAVIRRQLWLCFYLFVRSWGVGTDLVRHADCG